jgi:hypothetical protein
LTVEGDLDWDLTRTGEGTRNGTHYNLIEPGEFRLRHDAVHRHIRAPDPNARGAGIPQPGSKKAEVQIASSTERNRLVHNLALVDRKGQSLAALAR